MQVRGAIVHGELRAAVLGVQKRGQRGYEGLVLGLAERSGQLVTKPARPRLRRLASQAAATGPSQQH
jgi:hypothetical protein